MLVPGMYLADRYEIIEKIGSGGMADVYKAKCHKLNRLVAIKVLKSEYCADANFVRKFRVEAQSAAGLSHPNIVGVYDVGEESGIHYIVMELVQGITLKNYIDMKGKLDVREALNISIQIASGLSAAHQNRIIHRDIKPQNIIMSRDGKVKITDFGIAKAADSTTVTTSAAGSVHYISPEQARGGYSDAKSDIYSLGITMYEMLTGKVPFDGESNVAVALLHIQGQMTPPRQLEPSIPRSFEKIILKCTQKKPDRRYASAKELIADLRRVLSNPDGEYVTLAGSVADASTMIMSESDLAAMRNGRSMGQELQNIHANAGNGRSGASQNTGNVRNGQGQSGGQRTHEERRQAELQRQRAEQARQRQYDNDNIDDEDDDDEEMNPRLEKVMIVLGIVGAVILVIAICFIIGKTIGVFGNGSKDDKQTESVVATESQSESESEDVVMIDVKGMTQAQAESMLKEKNISYTVEEKASSEDKGTVVDQTPAAGTTISSATRVVIYVSSGAESFELKDYSGLTLDMVKTALQSLKLEAGEVTYEYSDDIDKDKVIKTNPEAGTKVKEGDKIGIVLSKGPEEKMTTMPTVIGLTESQAKSAVEDAKLVYGGATYESSEDVEKGKIMHFAVDGDRNVYEGQQVKEGSTVTVIVSSGSQYEGQTITKTIAITQPLDGEDSQEGTLKIVLTVNGKETIIESGRSFSASNVPYYFTVSGIYGSTGTITYSFTTDKGTYSNSQSVTFTPDNTAG